MRIIIPGGSGQVRPDPCPPLSRPCGDRSLKPAPWRVAAWDGLTRGDWIHDLERSGACINLAGRSVNCRYTAANRRSIHESRIRTTLLLNEVISSLKHP